MGKIVAINASPRKGWNTDTLVQQAAKGAESAGAEVERFDLYRLEKYTGCISCFGCKTNRNKGRCVCQDGLTPVLDAIREADGLIIGSPNYLGDLSAGFRCLFERLVFQNHTYNVETPCCSDRRIPILLIMTSNAPDTMYLDMLKRYTRILGELVGPTTVFVSGDTLQVSDYSKLDWEWSLFDPEKKKKRHETVFPEECRKAYDMGASLLSRQYRLGRKEDKTADRASVFVKGGRYAVQERQKRK